MFDVLSIFVADMGRSLAFYRLLGLEIPAEADQEAHAEHQVPGGFTLMWDTHDVVKSYDPAFSPPPVDDTGGASTGMDLAYRCASPEDVDRQYTAITDAGHHGHLAPFDAVWGQRYAIVVDPDGNHVALYAAAASAPSA